LIEEPPAQTLILLISQNTDVMLKTVLSRTQQILVPPIDTQAIASALAAKGIPHETAQTYAQLSNGNYIEAANTAAQNNGNEEFFNKFIHLMRICMGNKSENVITLLLWAEDVSKKFGREEQKQFLMLASRIIRESFMLNQGVKEIVCLENKVTDLATYIHCRNAQDLYGELNLAYGQIAANGNARIIFTDMALKIIKHIHTK
jgi:DNA polymerase-3 subunit delta'